MPSRGFSSSREQWQSEAAEYNLNRAVISRVAKSIYYTHWKELPNYRFPPVWESATEEIRDYVRAQAVRCILVVERGISLNSLALVVE